MYIKKTIPIQMNRYELDQQEFPGMYVDAIPCGKAPGMVTLYLHHESEVLEPLEMFSFTPSKEFTIENMIEGNVYEYAKNMALLLDASDALPENLTHLVSDDDCGKGDYEGDDCDHSDNTHKPTINTSMSDCITTGEIRPYIYFKLNQQKFPDLFVNVIPCDETPGKADVFLRHKGAEPFYMFTVNTKYTNQIIAIIDSHIEEYVSTFRKQCPDPTDDRIIAYICCECPDKGKYDTCGRCTPHAPHCNHCNHHSSVERESGEQKATITALPSYHVELNDKNLPGFFVDIYANPHEDGYMDFCIGHKDFHEPLLFMFSVHESDPDVMLDLVSNNCYGEAIRFVRDKQEDGVSIPANIAHLLAEYDEDEEEEDA